MHVRISHFVKFLIKRIVEATNFIFFYTEGENMECNQVKVFSLTTCGHCKALKCFFDDNMVPYENVVVDALKGEERAAAIEELKKVNATGAFPVIIIGEKVIFGNKQEEIREVLGL